MNGFIATTNTTVKANAAVSGGGVCTWNAFGDFSCRGSSSSTLNVKANASAASAAAGGGVFTIEGYYDSKQSAGNRQEQQHPPEKFGGYEGFCGCGADAVSSG